MTTSGSTSDSSRRPAKTRAAVDWAAVRARVEHAAAALEANRAPAPDATQEILVQRARKFARPTASPAAEQDTLGVVVFALAGQRLALPASAVRETVLAGEITPLPGLPPRVLGLVNVRGRILAVFDLRPVLQLPAAGEPAAPRLLIVAQDGVEFALLADEVTGTSRVSEEQMRTGATGLDRRHLRGVAADGLMLLDLASLLPALRIDAEGAST